MGTVFEVEQRTETDPATKEALPKAHAVQNSYEAVLGRPERFGRVVRTEAVRREFPEADDSIALRDGATWIWNLAGEHFGTSRQVARQ